MASFECKISRNIQAKRKTCDMNVVKDSMKQILGAQGKLVSTKLFNVLMYLKCYLIGFILCVILVQNLLVFIWMPSVNSHNSVAQ